LAELATLKITLRDIKPAIWRRVQVPGHFTLVQLHYVIQGAMGWHDKHLHRFEIDGADYDIPDGESFNLRKPHHDERKFNLSKLLKPGMNFAYLYDFGDDWFHDVKVEEIEAVPAMNDDLMPLCLDGARACPPEDCGGPHAYPELLAILKDKKHPRHADMVTWAGKLKPEIFSVAQATSLIYALIALEVERAALKARRLRAIKDGYE
jgi:hypothetical protein